jgi:hypothetical protein
MPVAFRSMIVLAIAGDAARSAPRHANTKISRMPKHRYGAAANIGWRE